VRIAQAQLLPAATMLSNAAATLPVPVVTDQPPFGAPNSTESELSYEQRRLVVSGVADALSAGPSGTAGEVGDALDAFAHPPHGPFGAVGYTLGLAVSLAVERSGQLQGMPLREWLGEAGWTTTKLVGSLMRHEVVVSSAAVEFMSLINDGIELRAKVAAERADDAAREAKIEAWLQAIVDAVRADPHALDPIIELSASQLKRSDNTPIPQPD
jgi:hypothetical protein